VNKRIRKTSRQRWLLSCLLLAALPNLAHAGEIGITYVKTIGQVWPELPMITGGGRLSVDEKGNLYAGTPGQNSFLQKFTPDGRVVWRADDTHCSYYGTAVDDKYVYGTGIGYYGYRHLLRRKKESGVVPAGWKLVWTKPTDIVNGVKFIENPAALLVDETYLFILDRANGEVRRLIKETGAEKPYLTPLKLEGAIDMAFSGQNSILLLANAREAAPPVEGAPPAMPGSVSAYDRETGKVLRAGMITGLRKSAAIAVAPKTGAIFIGEGGTPIDPVNKVRIFAADGKDTGKTVGRGGEWQGKWHADAFNFASGTADIVCDNEGGFWANNFGWRTHYLGLLTHFSPEYAPDKTFMAATGTGIAVDKDLNIAMGGNYKLSWNGDVLWTSGLAATGKPNQFPYTIDYWIMLPAYTDAQQTIVVNIHGPQILALNSQTGEATGKSMALPVPLVNGVVSAGQNIYILGGGKVQRTTTELTPLQEALVIPEDVAKKGLTGFAVSEDQSTFYISAGNGAEARVYAYRQGQTLWQISAGTVLTRYKNMLLTTDPAGPGILALNTDDGGMSGIFGNIAIEERPSLSGISGATIGSKDGKDYLFVACQSRVLVYRIVAAQ